MALKYKLTLPEALRVVSEVHTRGDESFMVEVVMGAMPNRFFDDQSIYVEAWMVIRREAYRRPYWWRNLLWRIRKLISGKEAL